MIAAESVSAATDSASIEGKYVYCIIRNDRLREFGEIGIGSGARVYTVNHKDLAAVVSDTPIVIYDPTRENVLAHEFVNETVMREFTLIPMSFGTIFRSENDVRALLNSTYQAFTDVLDKMQDKIEFGLKILWDRDSVVAAIERDNDEIRRLKDEKAFDEKVKAISLQYEDLLTFKYTGPWPPYNFVNIKLKLEKAT